MDTIASRLARQYPEDNLRIGSVVVPLQEELVGQVKPALLVLLGAVAFVLLIACANVANLLLARAAARQKEVGLRLALGATRSRVARQFLTESLLLALMGGAAGLLVAQFGLQILKRFIPDSIPRADAIAVDSKVFFFGIAASLVTGILFGLVPALQASKLGLNDSLKESGRDCSGGAQGNRFRSSLVIAEVAISFVLLIGAGLLIGSFQHLRNLDPGFKADHLLTMKVDLSEIRYPDRDRRVAFFEEVLRRVQVLPGVSSVAVGGNLPLTYNGDSMPIAVEGIPDPPPDQRADVIYRAVGPGYFSTMGIPVLRGRDFTDDDRADTKYGVVISQKTAEHFWPGVNPIGKRLKPISKHLGCALAGGYWVVDDVRQNDFVAPPKMEMYFTYRQLRDLAPNALVIRTSVPPMSLAAPVRSAIWAIDKDQTVADVDTMDHIVSRAVARQRFSMLLLGPLRRARARAGRGRYLWRDELLRRSTHARDRDSAGARRTEKRCP